MSITHINNNLDYSTMSSTVYPTIDSLSTITISNTDYDYPNISGVNDTFTWNNQPTASLSVQGKSTLDGDVKISGDLIVQGVNFKDMLEEINDKLAILKPNPELEERWEKLKELRRQYMELEKDILEKEEIVRILKR